MKLPAAQHRPLIELIVHDGGGGVKRVRDAVISSSAERSVNEWSEAVDEARRRVDCVGRHGDALNETHAVE